MNVGVVGGKWTSAMRLGKEVSLQIRLGANSND